MNVYYSPDAFGLTPVAEIEYSSGFYEFDIRVVWKDDKGNFYTARDSGCSCPTPFEEYRGIPELERLDFSALELEVRDGGSRWHDVTPGRAMDFLAAVREAMGT